MMTIAIKQALYIGLFLGVGVFPGGLWASSATLDPQPVAEQHPRKILVQYKSNLLTPGGYELSNFDIIKLKDGETLRVKLKELRNDPSVRRASPNYQRDVLEITPNDTDLDSQYSVDLDAAANIQVSKAWTVTKGSKQVVIAVVDTGVDLDHEDLPGKIWSNAGEIADNGSDDDGNGLIDDVHGWDFVHDNNNPNPEICDGSNDGITHGTHVSGIAAGKTNNDLGIAGIGWKTKVMALQVGECDGSMTDEDIANAIEYAVMMGADVINLSLGGFGQSSVLESVVGDAIDAGVTVVAAAGNNGINIDRFPFEPATIDGVITVAATDENDEPASFSNFGTNSVEIAAPGVNIYSTVFYDDTDPNFQIKYDSYSGTSMATPVVAGVVSLLKAQAPNLTPAEITTLLTSSAKDVGSSPEYGDGRVDALEAMLALDSVDEVYMRAYNNEDKDKEFKDGSTQSDQTPFFTITVPRLLQEDISGYFVYFGTNEQADPFTDGTFQTSKKVSVDKLKEANGKTYYLKVGVQKTDDSQFDHNGKFTYILDTP